MTSSTHPGIKTLKRNKNTLEDIKYDPESRTQIARTLYLQSTYAAPLRSQVIESDEDIGKKYRHQKIEVRKQYMGLYWCESYSASTDWSGWISGIGVSVIGVFMAGCILTLVTGLLPIRAFSFSGENPIPILTVTIAMITSCMLGCALILKKSNATVIKGKRLPEKDNWVHLPLGEAIVVRNFTRRTTVSQGTSTASALNPLPAVS